MESHLQFVEERSGVLVNDAFLQEFLHLTHLRNHTSK